MSVDQIEDDRPAEMVLPASIAAHLRQAVSSAAKTAYDGALVARDALAEALAEQSEISNAQTALQASIAAAQTAMARKTEVEAGWATFVIEDGLSATPDNAKRAELRAAVLAAREAIKPLAEDQAKLAELHTAGLAVHRRIDQHKRDVILAEAANLADAYHHHERLALKARAAIEGLARAFLATAERHYDRRGAHEMKPGEVRGDHSAAQPFIDLALTLRRSLDYGADPQTSAAGRAARIDAAETYGRSVAAWVSDLNADPHTPIPDLES